ncbi:MAG: DUF4038 domain-containing protein [Haloarculaceae archaeon]
MATTWHPHELTFEAADPPANPYGEDLLEARFEHETGTSYTVPGFWDGDETFRVRFAPTEPGTWTWETGADDPGLRDSGSFEAGAGDGETPLHEHGYLTADGRALVHADGTPFFWLADTAWAAGTRAAVEEWDRYLDRRGEQGYDVVQVNALRQHDGSRPHDRLPFGDEWDLDRPNHEYFRHLDALVAAAHERGIVPALVALWFDYAPGANPDWIPDDARHEHAPDRARTLGRYLGARYGAYGPAWLVSGDSEINEECLRSYRAAAEALGEACQHPLRTAHQPGGQVAPPALNDEGWVDFHMYQSGHTHDLSVPERQARGCRLLDPPRPVLNGEPCYADMQDYDTGEVFDRETVRAAGWVSVLSGANAGLTYGAHGVWPWHREGDTFESSDLWGEPRPWDEALELPSAADYARLADVVTSFDIHALNPRPDLLPDAADGEVAAVLPDGVLVYLRANRAVTLREVPPVEEFYWLDPASGTTEAATVDGRAGTVEAEAPSFDGDALLVGRRS